MECSNFADECDKHTLSRNTGTQTDQPRQERLGIPVSFFFLNFLFELSFVIFYYYKLTTSISPC